MIEFSKFFTEMALSNMQKIGKWDDKKNRHGYDKQSIGILSSPTGLKKIENAFNKVGDYDFNLYFVKKPNAWKHVEIGKIPAEKIGKYLGIEPGVDFPVPNENDITVFFTNNTAADRTPLTAWTIAHRIGHAFSATGRRNHDNAVAYYNRELNNTLKEIFKYAYNKYFDREPLYSQDYVLRDFFEQIGTMRSARMKKLNRPSEFLYELFAQYLLTGSIKFNPFPKVLKSTNKKAWGRDVYGQSYRLQNPEDAEDYAERLRWAFQEMFDYWLGSHVGTYSIM